MEKELFAIFGNPVAHSRSPLMHNYSFRALKYQACYTRYLLEDGRDLRDKFFSLGLQGANITVPHKEYAFKACDELDDFASRVKAVNTIVLREGKLYGYNTDAPGFLRVVEEFEGVNTILLLGAGGTAASSALILKEAGYEVTILNRSASRLEPFRRQGFRAYTWEEFRVEAFDLIVNMSSAGLQDESLPAPRKILEPLLRRALGAIDVIYGKETPFLRLAKEFDLQSRDGSEMLLYQGVIAFNYFTKGRFELERVEDVMRKSFTL